MFLVRLFVVTVLAALLVSCGGRDAETVKRVENLMKGGHFNQALEFLQQEIRENPESKRLLQERVRLFLKSGQVDYAVMAYRKLEEQSEGDAIFKQSLKDKDSVVRVAAVKALGLIRDASSVEDLTALVKDSEKNVRQAAIVALGDIKSEDAVPVLIKALSDKDWFIRAEAAQSLGKTGNASAVGELFKLLEDEDNYVRENARLALQNLATQENRTAYVKALDSEDASVRVMAALALAKTNDASGTGVLLQEIESADPGDRTEITKALVQLNENNAIPKIRKGVEDKNISVRVHSILALGWFKDEKSAAQFSQISKDEGEPGEVRLAALRALELMGRKD